MTLPILISCPAAEPWENFPPDAVKLDLLHVLHPQELPLKKIGHVLEIALVRMIVTAPSRRAYRKAHRLPDQPLGGPVPNLGSRAHI